MVIVRALGSGCRGHILSLGEGEAKKGKPGGAASPPPTLVWLEVAWHWLGLVPQPDPSRREPSATWLPSRSSSLVSMSSPLHSIWQVVQAL